MMNSDFKYFDWGISTHTSYALLDGLDNHFYLMSDNFEYLHRVMHLMKSKIVLEIVELPEDHNIDNSVVANWGLEKQPDVVFADILSGRKFSGNMVRYREWGVIRNEPICETHVVFDSFKQDLQQQIFFVNHCNRFIKQDSVKDRLQYSLGMGQTLDEVIDLFLDFDDIKDRQEFVDMATFVRTAGLFYE
jgi:hypothetical protein